jgi:hypothetical protein
MKTIQRATKPQQPRSGQTRTRGLLVLVLSFALVAAACSSDDDSSDTTAVAATDGAAGDAAALAEDGPDTEGDAALASAERLGTAFNEGDFETYRAVFAPDAGVAPSNGWLFLDGIGLGQGTPSPAVSPASFGLQLETECTKDNPTLVLCNWVQRGGVFERAGIELTSNVTLYFDEDGAVYNMTAPLVDERGDREPGQFYPAFGAWLREAHPDVFEATYTTPPDVPQPLERDAIDTLESRAQWAAVLDEFLAQSDTYPLAS